MSLTNALTFNNEEAVKIQGEFPGDTGSATSQGQVALEPGSSSAITTPAKSPDDPNDPAVASLVWMAGSDSFISLPSNGADDDDGNSLRNLFTVDPSVCNNLCDIIHEVQCNEAAQTASGTITQANLSTVILECTGSGNPAACPDGGSGGSGGSNGGDSTVSTGNEPLFCSSLCANFLFCDVVENAFECTGACRSASFDDPEFQSNGKTCLGDEYTCEELSDCWNPSQEVVSPSDQGSGEGFSGDICQLQCDLCDAGCDLQLMCEVFEGTCISRCEEEKVFPSEYYGQLAYCLGGKALTCDNFISCAQFWRFKKKSIGLKRSPGPVARLSESGYLSEVISTRIVVIKQSTFFLLHIHKKNSITSSFRIIYRPRNSTRRTS